MASQFQQGKNTYRVKILLFLLIAVACSSESPPIPTLVPTVVIPTNPTNPPIPTATMEPEFAISDAEFSQLVERVYDEWDTILDEEEQLTSQYISDLEYYLDAEFCNGDIDCEFDALNTFFDVQQSYLDSMLLLQQDLITINSELDDISRSDVSPEMEPILIQMREAGESFGSFFTYTFMAYGEDSGSVTQERLFNQAVEAYSEAFDQYEIGWDIYIGEADANDIQQIIEQPESLDFIGSGDRVREFSININSGIKVSGTHRGDSNFIGEIYNSSGELEAIVINCIGWCSDTSISNLDPGTYYLEITADGDWEISIELLGN